ncbi:MAG: rhodanese-like domain-containing protein [Verrucomicrobia bacterium]|nr:rhodanese-like domain-containing protein [Verrucomicrobiota bacterium]
MNINICPMAVRLTVTLAAFLAWGSVQGEESLASKPDATKVKHVKAVQARKLVAGQKVVVLDVRTPGEFQTVRIAGATNINFRSPDFERKLAALDKNQTYLLHCATGNRSVQALPVFKKLEFKSVIHLDGGIRDWEKAGLPVEK